MRNTIIVAGALALFGSAAIADDVIAHPIVPLAGVEIEHRASDEDVNQEKAVCRDADGCATRSVKTTNDDGDSVTQTKSNC